MSVMVAGKGHLGNFIERAVGVPPALHYTGELEAVAPAIPEHLSIFINAAGKTSLEWCESNPIEAFRCNVKAPLEAFRAFKSKCLRDYSLFIHLSSGCVWDGPFPPIGLGFTPNEPVTPQCFYSWTKAACDALLLQEAQGWNLAILRPRQVYSPVPSPRNTLTKLLGYEKLIPTPNSMTSAHTILKTITRLSNYPKHCQNGRIINVYDCETASPLAVGYFLAEAGLRETPKSFSKEELDKILHPKRVDVVLEDKFFEDMVNPPDVITELKRVIAEYAGACKTRGVKG